MPDKRYHAEHKRLRRLLDALATGEAENAIYDKIEEFYPIDVRPDNFTVILPETN